MAHARSLASTRARTSSIVLKIPQLAKRQGVWGFRVHGSTGSGWGVGLSDFGDDGPSTCSGSRSGMDNHDSRPTLGGDPLGYLTALRFL